MADGAVPLGGVIDFAEAAVEAEAFGDDIQLAAPGAAPPPVEAAPAVDPAPAAGPAVADIAPQEPPVEDRLRRVAGRLNQARELSNEQKALDKALQLAEQDADAKAFAPNRSKISIRNDFVAVRVYAYQVRADRQPGERVDFTETLYWHAGIKTDAKTGEATIEFGLNDSVTSFRVGPFLLNLERISDPEVSWRERGIEL